MDKKLTYTLIAGIIIITLSVSYYFVAFLPSQQRSELDLKRQEQLAKEAKETAEAEQQQKEYIGKRKKECYEIYEKEREQWNNTVSPDYDEDEDICRVVYKDNENPKRSEDECNRMIKEEDGTPRSFLSEEPRSFLTKFTMREYMHCANHTFDKEF